jgi:putative ABC transport system ATP-binding protein
MATIQLKDVSKLYGFGDATTIALEDVTLEVNKGEFVAIMGPSGSGKSTLMNMIGLLDRPTHGVYRLDGRSVEKLRSNARAKARRDKIGFVFQSPSLLPGLSVLENVALPLAYRGKSLTRRNRLAFEMLDRVGLANRAYFSPRQLSGGQFQRAVIARALINGPQVIIADEPTGNLDSISSRLVMELLREIHQMGNTILMVTHNPELTRYATRVLYMNDGNIIRDEETRLGEVSKVPKEEEKKEVMDLEEEDLANVSAIMSEIPDAQPQAPQRKKPIKKARSLQKRKRNRKAKGVVRR